MTQLITRIIDAIGEPPEGVTRRVLHGAEHPVGVVYHLPNEHEISVFRGVSDHQRVEVIHYDSEDNAIRESAFFVGALTRGDKVTGEDEVVNMVTLEVQVHFR